MSDLNKAQIIGRLGADPEKRIMSNGKAVTNIRVATSDKWTDRETGEKHEKTEWHTISAFDKLAEIMSQWLRKGSQVYIEGSLRTRNWTDKNGVDRYSTEIVASHLQMLGPKRDESGAMIKPAELPEDCAFGDDSLPF